MPFDTTEELHAVCASTPREFESAQDMLNRVAWHLFTQRARSMLTLDVGDTPFCAYRGAEGRMCAIGIGIPDGVYDRGMEGLSLTALLEMCEGFEFTRVLNEHTDLAGELQLAHDRMLDGYRLDLLHERLEHIAAGYALDDTQVQAAYKHARGVA